jgi:predicted small lipoprotein YifL
MKKHYQYFMQVLTLLSFSLLLGCGQKDDLYLPDKQALINTQESLQADG